MKLGWAKARLDECAEIVAGATPSTSVDSYWGGDVCWATPKDMSELEDAYISDTPRKLTRAGLENCAATVLPSGSVLFSSRAPIGHVAVNTVPMATNQGFKSFVPKPERVVAKFLYWWLRTNRTYLESLGNGATFKEVSKAIVSRIEISLPPLAEQRRIAEVLDRAEALRAKRSKALAQLDSLTQSLFLDLFGDPISNPKGFPKRKVSEVVSRLTNGFVGPTRDIYHETGVPYLLARHVKANRLKFDGKTFVSETFNRKHSKSILKAGDVLLVQSGHVGESAVVPIEHEGHNCHAMIVITPRPELLTGHFLSQLFSTEALRRAFGGIETGITLAHLNCRDVRELSIPIPPISLQREFACRVTAVEKLKTAHRASLAELDALFATLQHRAFRGEL